MELLAEHRVLDTDDLDEARERIAAEFCEHRLEPVGRERGHRVRFNSVTGAEVGLSWLDYGGAVRLRPQPFRRFVLVQVPLAGRSVVRTGGRAVHSRPGIATVPDPDRPSDMAREEDNPHLLVRIDRDAVASRWAALTGTNGPVHLDPALDLRTPLGRAWRESVDVLAAVRGCGGPDGLARRAEQLVVSQLLLAQPHHAEMLHAPPALAAPRAVREAEGWLVAHAREAVSVEDAAAVVGLSVRALQAGFRRHLGSTPTERLREARLVGAHRDLQGADPGATTVSDVATAWGFGHLGRFASAYRARFGRSPRDVLRS